MNDVNTMSLREFRTYLEDQYTDAKWPQVVRDRVWTLTYDNSKGECRETWECTYYEYVGLVELSLDNFTR